MANCNSKKNKQQAASSLGNEAREFSKNSKTKYSKRRKSNTTREKFNASTATNNPAWYGADPAILRDSASLPFSYPVGTPINLNNPTLSTLPTGQEFTIPGFMTLLTSPTIGYTDNPSDPINVAAFRVYTYVRHMNAGHTNYDAPDLMLYLLAMTQVYSYINFLQRAYGVVYTYAQKNRYLPDALLQSMGINSDDVRNNLAQFRYGINVLINKAAALCVPGTMAIFAQQASLYQNIYIEGDSIKDQMYLFTPASFWIYKLNTDSSGMLEAIDFYKADKLYTADELISYGSNLLAQLVQSEDMNIMSGDIRKAYGDAALIKLVPLNVDFPIAPLRDIAVLQQMKNATVIPMNSGRNVTQDTTHGYLVHKPSLVYTVPNATWATKAHAYALQTFLEDKILSVNSVDPTPEEIMETTRLIPLVQSYYRSDDWKVSSLEIHGCTVIVTDCKVWDFKIGEGQTLRSTRYTYTYDVVTADANNVAAALRLCSLLGHFKYHPVVHMIATKQGTAELSFNVADGYLCYDVDNYTVVSGRTLERMHEAALLSLLNVPSVTKIE